MSLDFLLSVFRVEKKIAGLRPQGLFPPAPEVEGIGKGHDESSTQTVRTAPSASVGTCRMASRQVELFSHSAVQATDKPRKREGERKERLPGSEMGASRRLNHGPIAAEPEPTEFSVLVMRTAFQIA